jgi:hypothetical protein
MVMYHGNKIPRRSGVLNPRHESIFSHEFILRLYFFALDKHKQRKNQVVKKSKN